MAPPPQVRADGDHGDRGDGRRRALRAGAARAGGRLVTSPRFTTLNV